MIENNPTNVYAVFELLLEELEAEVEFTNKVGTKVVATALGDIMCREVSLTMQRRQMRLWYELAEPRRLAGMFDPERGTELRLAGYRASSADTDSLR